MKNISNYFNSIAANKSSKNCLTLRCLIFVIAVCFVLIFVNLYLTNQYRSRGPRLLAFPPPDKKPRVHLTEPTVIVKNKNERFVIYECHAQDLCGGLADRFKAIVNAYAWSLFTNRTLIVSISKPCYFQRLFEPNKIIWNLNLTQLVETGRLPQNFSLIKIDQIDNFLFKNDLANLDLQAYYADTHVIRLFTNIEWISAYNNNK